MKIAPSRNEEVVAPLVYTGYVSDSAKWAVV